MNGLHPVLIVTRDPLTGLGLKQLLAERFALTASWSPLWDDLFVTEETARELECVFCDEGSAPSIPHVLAGRGRRIVLLRETAEEHERYSSVNIRVDYESLIAGLSRALIEARGQAVRRSGVLSDREKDALTLLARGLINKEIADRLGISIHTAISHRKNISVKLGIRSVSGLTVYATIHGLVEPDSVI